MKKAHRLSIFILMLVMQFGCGNSPASKSGSSISSESSVSEKKVLVIVPEVEQDFIAMNEYLISYMKKNAIDNLVFEYIDEVKPELESASLRGYCDIRGSTPKIILYRPDWIGIYASTDSNLRTATFYHLVGHCVFGKLHHDQILEDGVSYRRPASFMNSSFGNQLFSVATFNASVMVDLQREFFGYYGVL